MSQTDLPNPSAPCVFVSSQAVDRWPAQALISAFRTAGLVVEHSPSNPAHRDDPRWATWYAAGLAETLRRCVVFVIVVDQGWDSSTWMAIEAQAALRAPAPLQGFFWNPDRLRVVAQGMTGYLREELLVDVPAAVDTLVRAMIDIATSL